MHQYTNFTEVLIDITLCKQELLEVTTNIARYNV